MTTIFRKSLSQVVQKGIMLTMLLVAGINIHAGATIAVTKATSTICTNYASSGTSPKWTALGTMTIREANNADLGNVGGSWSVSIVLAAPTGWQFNTAVSPTVAYTATKNITAATVGTFTSTSLTINISGTNKNKGDKVTITGLQVQPTSSSAVAGNIVPSSITGTANGLTTNSILATMTPSSPVAGSAGVTVSSAPSNAICAGTSVTFTSAVTNGGTTPAYQWKLNGSNISGATSSTYSSSALTNGNTIICSVISYSCISTPTATSATQTMTVNALPAAIGGSSSVCTGNTVTYTNSVIGGTWSSSNTDVATVGAATGAVAGVTAGTATITYSTGTGCTATKVITVNASPTSITGTGSVCVSATTSLSSSAGAWSSSATGVATVNSSTGVVTGVAAGNATITLSAANGCNTTTVVTVNAIPSTITGAAVCAGLTTTLSNSVAGGTWTSSNANATVGAASGVVTGVTAGTSVMTYTLGGGCYKTAVVTVNTTPVAITGASAVCTSSTTTLSNATGSGTWASSTTGVATITSGGVVSGVAQGTTTISYSLSTGCRATAIMSVSTTPAAIGGSGSICSGLTTTLTNTSLYGTWSSSNITAATVSAAGVVTGGASGTATISYATGCGAAATKVVTVSNSPITGTMKVCTGFTTTLADAAAGGTWSSSSTSIATVGSATGVVSGVANGTATISYINGGCTATAVVTVSVAPAAITGSTAVCQGSTATLSNTILYGAWSSDNSSIASVGSATGVVTGLAEGATVITYNTGCGASSTATFTVNVLPAAISGVSTVCAGSTQTLSSSGSGTWSSSNTGVATVGSSTGVVTGMAAGTSTITYALATGCSVTGVVTVNAVPSANSGSGSVCQGSTTMLTNGTGGGSWVSSNTSVATVGSLSGVVTGVTAGTASLSYTLSTGCAAVTVVTVNALPSTITGTSVVCPATATTLSSVTAGGTWTSSVAGVATVNSSTGEVTGVAAGTSNISYILSTGCKVGKQVTVNASPSAIGGTATVCVGATTTLTDAGGGTWASGNTAVATVGSSNGVVTGVSSGTAVVTYTLSTGCTATKVVSINTVPSAGVISGGSSVCELDAIVLTSTVEGGTWTVSDAAVVDMDPATGEAFGLAAGTVTVSYEMTNTCGTTYATSTLTVESTPTVNVTTGTAAMCAGASTTLSNSTAGGAWSSTNASAATVNATGVVTGVAAGTSTMSYTITNSCGSVAATTEATVNALPGAISGTAAVCAGATTTLANAGGGTWSSSNGNATVGSASGVVTGVTAGTSTITYTLSTGCATTTVVTVNALPAVITGTASVCEGATTTLNNITAGGTWSSSNTAVATVSAAGVVSGVVAGNATITYALSTGCTATKVVTVNAQPATISGTATMCEGATATLSNAVAGGTWSSSNANATVGAASGVVAGVTAGTSTITYTLSAGCATTTVVTVNALPGVITGTASVCEGATTTLNDITGGGTWSSSNTAVATVSAAGLVSGVVAGNAIVTYTLSTGCKATKAVTVNAQPAAISGTAAMCEGATATFSNVVAGGTWSSSNANATVGAASGVVTGVTAGTSTITYTLSAGCATTTVVTVNALPGVITGTASVCEGATTTLNDITGGGTWSSSNTAVATVSAAGLVSGVVAGNATVTYTLSTGCKATKAVTVNAQPAAISGTAAMCEGATATLSNAVAGGAWNSSNGNATVGAASGVVTGVTAGTSTITYTLSTGCTTTVVVTVNTLPAAIGGTTAVCEGLTTTLSNAIAGGTWSSSNGNATVGITSGVITGVAAGTSRITYALGTGCAATTTVTVNAAADVITGTAEVCAGATTTLANTVAGGTWSSNNVAVAGIDTYTGVVNGVAAGIATITYAMPTGCPAMRTVTVNMMPTAITGTAVVCAGSATTLSNVTVGGAWSSSAAGVATIDAAGVVTGTGAGVATISYAMPTGCMVTYPVTVNALPLPILGDNLLCLGVATLYYADSTPGGTWSTANASVATIAATGGLTGVAAGNTTVSYTTSAGCFVTTPVTVTASVAAITGPATVCTGSTTTLENPMPGGVWSSKIPAWAPIDAASGVVTGISTGVIPMTYSFGHSCYAIKAVTVNSLPGTIGGVPAMCAGLSTSLSNPTTGGVWSSSDASVASASGVSATWASVSGLMAGTATITYTLPTGCFRAKDVTVNPIAPISGPSTICMGEATTLTNVVPGGTWSSSMAGSASVGLTNGIMTGLAGGSSIIMYYLPTGCKATMTVTVNRTSVITGATVACVGSTITLANSISGGAWSSSDDGIATTPGTVGAVTGVSAGTAVITYTTSTGCNKMVTVTVNAAPDEIAGPGSVCAGSTITMENTVAGGSWALSSTSVASIGSATGIVTGIAQNHTVTVSYTMPSGCRATKTISINAVPSVITGVATLCQGSTVTFTNSVVGGTWTSSNETVATVGSTGAVSAVSAGTAVITYALGTGCMQTKAITVYPISPIVAENTVCIGSAIMVSDATAGGTWASSVAARASVTASGVISGLAAGTAIISYSMPSGCSVTSVVTINALPTISGTGIACVGLTTTLTGSVAGGTWSSSNTAIADVNPSTGVVTGGTPGNATITYTLPTGCFATKVATINAFPSAIAGPSIVCMGSTATLENAVSGGTWSSTMAVIATVSTSGVVTGVAAGTTNISYTTGAGCVVGKLVSVSPISVISGTTSACLGMTTTLSCTSTGGTWNSSNSAIAPVSATGVVSGVSSGTAVISYTIPSGCARTVVVSVNPAATTITGVVNLCAGFPSTLAGNIGGGTWSVSNAAIASIAAATGVVSGVAGGTAVVTYTSGLGCRITAIITVNASAAITGTLKVCAGSPTTLASTTAGGVWSGSNPAVAAVDPSTGVVMGLMAGTSVVTYSPASGCGRTVVVTVNPLPAAIGGALNSCIGSTSIVTNSTTGGVSYTSSNPSIASVGATSGIVTGVSAGTALITYTVNTGCISTAVYTVNELPSVIEGPASACVASTTTLSSSTAGGTWLSSNAGRASVGLTTGVVTGITAGTFNVTYTLPTGCRTSTMITVNPTSAITGPTSVNAGAMITLGNATTGGVWGTSDGYTATIDGTTGVVAGVSGGTVNITYTTAAGCARTTTVTVNTVAGRAAEATSTAAAEVTQIEVYPNPTTGAFAIKTQNGGVLSVYGIDGKEAGRYPISVGETPVQLPQGLVAGIYMCRFTDANNNTTIIRLVYQP